MYGNRTLTSKKKSILILDKKQFSQFDSFDIGEHGQALFTGTIVGERIDVQEDGVELKLKTIKVGKIEVINSKNARNYF